MKTSHKVGAGSAAVIDQPPQKPQRAIDDRTSVDPIQKSRRHVGWQTISKKWGEAGPQPTMVLAVFELLATALW
jgi:hypothetical protein